jgi:hypothetical protein
MELAPVILCVRNRLARRRAGVDSGPSSLGACQVEGTASAAGFGGPDGGAATTPRPITPTSSAPNAGMRRRLSVKVSNASVAVLALGVKENGHRASAGHTVGRRERSADGVSARSLALSSTSGTGSAEV